MRAGVVEALLILGLVLALHQCGLAGEAFYKLFEREAALYRQIVSRISAHAGQYQQLPDLLEFVEQQTAAALKLRRVQIVVTDRDEPEEVEAQDNVKLERATEDWTNQILEASSRNDWSVVEDNELLKQNGFTIAYPLR